MWASRFAETKTTENVGGKDGVLGIGASPGVDVTNYAYTVNVAYPILDGRIGGIADVYFDGNRIDLEAFDYELKRGFEPKSPVELSRMELHRADPATGDDAAPGINAEVPEDSGSFEDLSDELATWAS